MFHCRAEGAPKNLTEGLNCRAKRKGRGPRGGIGTGQQTGMGTVEGLGVCGENRRGGHSPSTKGDQTGGPGMSRWAHGGSQDTSRPSQLLSEFHGLCWAQLPSHSPSVLPYTAPVSCRHPQIEVSPSLTSFPPSPHIPQLPKNQQRLRTAIPGPLQRDGERERAAAPPERRARPGMALVGFGNINLNFWRLVPSCGRGKAGAGHGKGMRRGGRVPAENLR